MEGEVSRGGLSVSILTSPSWSMLKLSSVWSLRMLGVTMGTGKPKVTLAPDAVSRVPAICSPACDPTRGCAAPGAAYCDACAVLRVASILKCVLECPYGQTFTVNAQL
jgi:hypothetical protein